MSEWKRPARANWCWIYIKWFKFYLHLELHAKCFDVNFKRFFLLAVFRAVSKTAFLRKVHQPWWDISLSEIFKSFTFNAFFISNFSFLSSSRIFCFQLFKLFSWSNMSLNFFWRDWSFFSRSVKYLNQKRSCGTLQLINRIFPRSQSDKIVQYVTVIKAFDSFSTKIITRFAI